MLKTKFHHFLKLPVQVTQQSALRMTKNTELRECLEAREFAELEFNRVKRVKLENERAKSIRLSEYKNDKQLNRERCNRASAAASRAKIVFYSKELEKRTDRLEMERNREMKRANKATKKRRALQEEVRNLKKALRDIWEMKDQRTCSYLMESEALFMLSSRQENSDLSTDDSGSDTDEAVMNSKREIDNHDLMKPRNLGSSELRLQQKQSCEFVPKKSTSHLSTPVRTTSAIRNLVNPVSVEPVVGDMLFSPCTLSCLGKSQCSLPLSSVTLLNRADPDSPPPCAQRSVKQ